MESRELLDLEPTRRKLVSFIRAAKEGHYYRPMEAVGRVAALEHASESLGQESILGVLVGEVRDLRLAFEASRSPKTKDKKKKKPKQSTQIAHLLNNERKRKLKERFLEHGGSAGDWTLVMSLFLKDLPANIRHWEPSDWEAFVSSVATVVEGDKVVAMADWGHQIGEMVADREIDDFEIDQTGTVLNPTDDRPAHEESAIDGTRPSSDDDPNGLADK